MKLGKIYDYHNKEEAKKLIGKKVIVSDYLCNIEEVPVCNLNDPGTLMEIREDNEYPFSIENDILFQFIREIEEEKPKLMTNRQFAKWLAKGNGLWKHEPSNSGTVYHYYWFLEKDMNKEIPNNIVIMPNDSDEWVVPTLDIYEKDCRNKNAK